MADRRHVNTTRSHIGRHQNLDTTVAQVLQTAITHVLRHGTVQGGCVVALLNEFISNGFGINLRACEHQNLIAAFGTQPMAE